MGHGGKRPRSVISAFLIIVLTKKKVNIKYGEFILAFGLLVALVCRLPSETERIDNSRHQAILCTICRVILSVLDPRKCEYLKDCSLDFEHAYMTTYLAS